MTNKDHLSNKVSLDVTLSEKGISGSAKLRTLAAFDRLLGSIIDIPTPWLEGISMRKRAKNEIEIKKISSQNLATINPSEFDETLVGVVKEVSELKQITSTLNKRIVADKTIEYLSEDDTTDETDSGNIELEEDWLNQFEQYSEKASTERMQDLWARVLAGEIRKPRSFSLVTLRFLSELDKEIAELFERETKHRIKGGFILKPNEKEMRGRRLLDMTFLEEVGLLQDVNGDLTREIKPDKDGIVLWREGNLFLKAKLTDNLYLPIIRITRIGREITNMLPQPNYQEVLENLWNMISNSAISGQIELILQEVSPGKYQCRPIKIFKKREESK